MHALVPTTPRFTKLSTKLPQIPQLHVCLDLNKIKIQCWYYLFSAITFLNVCQNFYHAYSIYTVKHILDKFSKINKLGNSRNPGQTVDVASACCR